MAREEWKNDIEDGLKRERWTLFGPHRIVKVTPIFNQISPTARGYICMENVLTNKTPAEIGRLLGVARKFDDGVRIYALQRLPSPSEISYELTAQFPDGLVFDPVMHSPDYPPGSAHVHQWQLKVDIPARLLVELKPDDRYPRPSR